MRISNKSRENKERRVYLKGRQYNYLRHHIHNSTPLVLLLTISVSQYLTTTPFIIICQVHHYSTWTGIPNLILTRDPSYDYLSSRIICDYYNNDYDVSVRFPGKRDTRWRFVGNARLERWISLLLLYLVHF